MKNNSLTPCDPPTPILTELSKHPVEGFSAGLIDDDNVYEWEITIFGLVAIFMYIQATPSQIHWKFLAPHPSQPAPG